MTTSLDSVPHALLHSLKHHKAFTVSHPAQRATLEVPTCRGAASNVETINGQFRKVKVFFVHGHAGPAASVEWCGDRDCTST
jgi:hypothetical protein